MNFSFDLISDLNLAPGQMIDWYGKPTSLQCIVNGNISSDIPTVIQTLEHLQTVYDTVLYLDGMLEHCHNYKNSQSNYSRLQHEIDQLEGVVFLNNNIIMLESTVIIATNGWSTFNFDIENHEPTIQHLHNSGQIDFEQSDYITHLAHIDQAYLMKSVDGLQQVSDVENIIVITNAVPFPSLINHDKTLSPYDINRYGSLGLTSTLDLDINRKIHTWIFGRYQGDMDVIYDGIRYVNNTFVSGDLNIYYPKRIEITI
jgi:hypothetical protein